MIEIKIQKQLHGAHGIMDLDIDVKINNGSFVAISGKSGSGKTTFLRILAGLESAKGFIKVDDEVWMDSQVVLKTQQRAIGFVFQDYALFDNMSVENNLLFVKKDKELAERLLQITELTTLKKRMPKTLSGGQKQRVSLCRAMMQKPRLLLMDEPLSALDSHMRLKLQGEILALHKEFGTTTIMVTHEPSEIYKLASRVVVLEQGRIINDGNPKDILLKLSGSQKFSFEGEILEIRKVDVIFVAIIAIGQQIVEVVVGKDEVHDLHVGKKINVSTKAFSPIIR
ncbi:ATP-binding cassette domain-containing protein [Sulfurimonas sp. SAG-AH-194-I05]|nr:ATP-binding cassette domain-containing protein [Sulfurimonas sp. SAG-AH-194-I05]MDF1874934.1 ATP-binding cassette domain-containing protein [Sulfurimonas sp. SAG-AH-194-I05]